MSQLYAFQNGIPLGGGAGGGGAGGLSAADVVDGRTSTDPGKALSANQGKLTKDEVDALAARLGISLTDPDWGAAFTGSTLAQNTSTLKALLQQLESKIEQVELMGDFVAPSATTFAALPTQFPNATALKPNDWSVLTLVDGTNPAGLYITDGTTWSLLYRIADPTLITNAEIDAVADPLTTVTDDSIRTISPAKLQRLQLTESISSTLDATNTSVAAPFDARSKDRPYRRLFTNSATVINGPIPTGVPINAIWEYTPDATGQNGHWDIIASDFFDIPRVSIHYHSYHLDTNDAPWEVVRGMYRGGVPTASSLEFIQVNLLVNHVMYFGVEEASLYIWDEAEITGDIRPLDLQGSSAPGWWIRSSGIRVVQTTAELTAFNLKQARRYAGVIIRDTNEWCVWDNTATEGQYEADEAPALGRWIAIAGLANRILSVNAVTDLPDPATVPVETMAFVLDDSKSKNNGIYLAIGTPGNLSADGWVK